MALNISAELPRSEKDTNELYVMAPCYGWGTTVSVYFLPLRNRAENTIDQKTEKLEHGKNVDQ